ncbi:RTA1 like protein-domain-containing protein, partial [Mycena rebaudengoi]
GFLPKKAPAIIGITLFSLSAAIHWFHFFTHGRHPFMLTLTIGMTAMATGFGLRVAYIKSPYTQNPFIEMILFILLSPCAFLAIDYMLLSRLAATLDEVVARRCLLVRSNWIVKIFVWSDVGTFLLQATGGSLETSTDINTAHSGHTVAIVGLCLQLVSFLFFTVTLIVFSWRLSHEANALKDHPKPLKIFSREPIYDWRILVGILCATCVGILMRSLFRIAEYAGGYDGYLSMHEAYFYALDALPLWVAMTLFCVVWPTRCVVAPKSPDMEFVESRTPPSSA